ncbi:hypothetical protein BH11PSE10_BH11PSE10_04390 [soil metagenome]
MAAADRLLVCLVGLSALLSGAAAAADDRPRLQSGIYEGLLLAVAADGHVSGYYREEQGEGVVKRCTFSLAGQVGVGAPGKASLVSWSSTTLAGRLEAQKDAVSLAIPDGREHSGCALVLLPAIATGLSLDKSAPAGWIELRRISVPRANFFQDAAASKPMKAYVVAGDVVGVLAVQGELLQIDYVSRSGRKTSGWIKAAQADRLVPPQ